MYLRSFVTWVIRTEFHEIMAECIIMLVLTTLLTGSDLTGTAYNVSTGEFNVAMDI